MKIQSASNMPVLSGAMASYAPRAKAAARNNSASNRFDSITISGEAAYNSFEMEMKSRIAQDVRANATPGRLSALQEQVQNDTYQPDPMSIARRMLLLVGDD